MNLRFFVVVLAAIFTVFKLMLNGIMVTPTCAFIVMLGVNMLTVICVFYCNAECRYAGCYSCCFNCYAECHYVDCH